VHLNRKKLSPLLSAKGVCLREGGLLCRRRSTPERRSMLGYGVGVRSGRQDAGARCTACQHHADNRDRQNTASSPSRFDGE
jgi:hypothetical protein